MKTYRVDAEIYGKLWVKWDCSSSEAMRLACQVSRRFDTSAYAIAREGDRDTGQRVYVNGRFSHTDDAF